MERQRACEAIFVFYDWWNKLPGRKDSKEVEMVRRLYHEVLAFHPFFSILATKAHIYPDVLPPVSNQKKCGCCYAFTICDSTSNLIATTEISKEVHAEPRSLKVFSPQFFVNTMPYHKDESQIIGCRGCNMEHAFKFASKKGLRLLKHLPYRSIPGENKEVAGPRVNIKKYKVDSGKDLRYFLFKQAVCGKVLAFPSFKSFRGQGIYKYDPIDIRYADIREGVCNVTPYSVLVIGWTENADGEVVNYLIKNSWGRVWGFRGFGRIHPSVIVSTSLPMSYVIRDDD